MLAQIRISQGATDYPAGEAAVGLLTTPVFFISADNTGIAKFEWEVLDRPVGSSVQTGLVAVGATSQVSVIPDLVGAYLVELRVFDSAGRMKRDRTAFVVPETVGAGALIIPPWLGDDANLNFGGQTKGWATLMRAWLKYVTTISGGGGGSSNPVWPTRALSYGTQTLNNTDVIGYFTQQTTQVNLPAAPINGQLILLVDPTGQLGTLVPTIISGNGQLIDNVASITTDGPHSSMVLSYQNGSWAIVAKYIKPVGTTIVVYDVSQTTNVATIDRTAPDMHVDMIGNYAPLTMPTSPPPNQGDRVTVKATGLGGGTSVLAAGVAGNFDGAGNAYIFTAENESATFIYQVGKGWRIV
jgi:hypothetical protein